MVTIGSLSVETKCRSLSVGTKCRVTRGVQRIIEIGIGIENPAPSSKQLETIRFRVDWDDVPGNTTLTLEHPGGSPITLIALFWLDRLVRLRYSVAKKEFNS